MVESISPSESSETENTAPKRCRHIAMQKSRPGATHHCRYLRDHEGNTHKCICDMTWETGQNRFDIPKENN